MLRARGYTGDGTGPHRCPVVLVPEAAVDALADLSDELHEVLPECGVEEDVEDHVGRRVDHEHEVADAHHDGRPRREVLLAGVLQSSSRYRKYTGSVSKEPKIVSLVCIGICI